MRIAGGRLGGRTLYVPAGRATRPTADRVREAIFNVLAHGIVDFDIEGARVLDLFAGSGALGLEALSRGARFVLFVEHSAAARAVIRRNAEELGVIGQIKIWRRDAARLGPCAPMPPFDLAFLDPPYGKGLGEAALKSLIAGEWLEPGAVAVLEEAERSPVDPPESFSLLDRRAYGDTQVLFYRH